MKRLVHFMFYCLLVFFSGAMNEAHKLSDSEIWEIYNVYIKPNMSDEDKFRYVNLPLEKNRPLWPWEGKDLPRVISNLEFERFVRSSNITCKKGLAINGLDPEWNHLVSEQIVQIDYLKDQNKYDLHTLDLPEKDFDFVICCQTLEHVYDPIRCLKNIYRHMRPGGILYLLVPGDTIPHDTPIHFYTGFTATGVGAMLKLAGFRLLNIGQWGNLEYLTIMHRACNWPDYRTFNYPIINDFHCSPITVWAFACK